MNYTNYNHIQGGTSDRSDLGKPHKEEWKDKRETKKSKKKNKSNAVFKGTQLAKQLPKPPGGGGYKGPKGVLDPKKASEEKNGEGKKLRSPAHRYLFGRKLFALGRRPSGNLSRLYNFWLTQAENISKDDRPELELKHLAITQGTQVLHQESHSKL